MTWRQWYYFRGFLKTSFWLPPVIGLLLAYLAIPTVNWADRNYGGGTVPISIDNARTVGSVILSTIVTFIVFVFSFLLVALQLASAQLTPRIIARALNDPFPKCAVGFFVFTYYFTMNLISHLEGQVPYWHTTIAGYLNLLCMAGFLFLVGRSGKSLRPITILTGIATGGRKVIRNVYPDFLPPYDPSAELTSSLQFGTPTQTIDYTGRSGVVLAFDLRGLIILAQKADATIELVPQVGDFVSPGDPLFRVYQANFSISEKNLLQSIAFGGERTLEQDPTFAFRMIVDIAAKALSPAINDPTTGVLALDQIHHLLGQVGQRQLNTGREVDTSGRLRLVYRTPNWDDFVDLAVTEIRQYGKDSFQIVRRLKAMLENLEIRLPEIRRKRLRQELDLLHRTVDRNFPDPEIKTKAELADLQGVGSG